jgi:hypothetical protein
VGELSLRPYRVESRARPFVILSLAELRDSLAVGLRR